MKTRSSNLEVLKHSPFFEVFAPSYLEQLAQYARVESFPKDHMILKEGDLAEHFYILIKGEVKLYFELNRSRNNKEETFDIANSEILIRKIVDPGRPIGWSAMVEPHRYRCSAISTAATQLIVFDQAYLKKMCHSHADFGVTFMRRILWILGNRLRATRIRLVAKRYEKEVIAIRALLDQSAETLSVNSPLFKIPYYLENRLTLSDAFQCLEILRAKGTVQEKNLAELCLEILENIKKELYIFQSLQTIYEHVTLAPAQKSQAELRDQCCEEFTRLFDMTQYQIEGLENLPEKSGNVFIMNHIFNHPDNILPNHFQLNHDVHFVASMIIYQKYKRAPIRVIRQSFLNEYGHKKYYDRLGFIVVGSNDPIHKDTQNKDIKYKLRQEFLDRCTAHLSKGDNISICPEGQPTHTQKSPLPFKAGAFRISRHMQPEPLIVPIALANFDKKFSETKLVAIIKRPFYLSDFVKKDANDQALFTFVNSYQETYKKYVQEAIDLAQD